VQYLQARTPHSNTQNVAVRRCFIGITKRETIPNSQHSSSPNTSEIHPLLLTCRVAKPVRTALIKNILGNIFPRDSKTVHGITRRRVSSLVGADHVRHGFVEESQLNRPSVTWSFEVGSSPNLRRHFAIPASVPDLASSL
jgi:hypothetical protein